MYLFVFYCIYLFVLFIVPSYLTYKKTGINPYKFSKGQTAINYVGKVYRIISFFAFLIVAINVFIPDVMTFIYPIEFLQLKEIEWIGYALIHISCIWIFIAQRNMSDEWRIGIDIENKVQLITKGLFSISRNPIFLGVIVLFVGLFLIIPNIVTVIILITGIIVIQIQVRLEEEFLIKKLGEEYILYMNQVKRWLF